LQRQSFLALGLVCWIAGLGSLRLHGQLFDSKHAEQNEVKFSAEENKVLERLGSLQTLPNGSWRFHSGDVAHGESPSLDDSSWQVVQPKSEAGKEAVWYRRTIEVPKTLNGYDLTGAEVSFRFLANANGPMPEILYFNGRRVAMGDDLEQVQLFSDAKPGDKILVAVKLLPTVDVKRFERVEMKISFAANRPDPEDLRKEFVSAGALVPSLAQDAAADRKTLTIAVSEVDLAALDRADQAKFDASLRRAQATLSALRPLLQTNTFHLTGNSHIDAAWLSY
jgi:alpha-mannosidase